MNRILIFMTAVLWMASLPSCSENIMTESESGTMRIVASSVDSSAVTRSVLDETWAFENMVSCMTIAAFDDETGLLAGYAHQQAAELDISLPTDKTYRIFLLANMGDQTGNIPYRMSEMESFSYDIMSYSRLKGMGLPMVCVAVTPWTPEITLNLRRLMAKLVIKVDKGDIADMGGGGEESFRNHRVTVHRIARVLYPFVPEGSAAKGEAELFDAGEIEYDTFGNTTASRSEELLLYVPENMQGNKLSGNGNPDDKSETNPELAGKELCTYVSLNGYKDGGMDGVYGNLIYRFFPGSDNVSNFDLRGGKRYDVTLKLTWNGMYTEGDWKVERSDWSDNRRILVSIVPEGGYQPDVSTFIARGSVNVPVYIYYSPQGKAYDGSAVHNDMGWMFRPLRPLDGSGSSVPSPKANTDEFAGSMMSSGFEEHTARWTRHYVTVPSSTPAGYENTMSYFTNDGREEAGLKISVTEPVIDFAPSSMLFLFHEYGYGSRRTIRVDPASPVRPCNITVYTHDDDLITLGTFDTETGKVDVYWNDTNTLSYTKTAEVYLHSEACGVTVVCTLTQQNRPNLSVDEEEDGGDASIEY